MTVKQLAMT